MANAKAKSAIAVTPPAILRGGRKSKVDPAVIAAMVETIESGDFAGVPDTSTDSGLVEYKSESGSDQARRKARNTANSAAVRHKKAIVNSPDNGIDDAGELKTRVWEAAENVFVWAVGPKVTGDSEDDAE